jgi:hypoxanthine-guanine phosphoribosyltransferase
MDIDNEKIIEYSSYINDKDILILDDTIGSGNSISEATRAINDTFDPKSITVITLFSKLD